MKPMHTLRNILSHPKDRVPDVDKSNVVHKIGCHDCNVSYVGETGRALKARLSEHRKAVEDADFLALPWQNILGATTIRLTGRTSESLLLSFTTPRGWPGKRSTYTGNLSHSTGIRALCWISTYCPHNDTRHIRYSSTHSEFISRHLL